MDKFTGRVWVLGDDIDTDIIIPTEYLALKTIDDMKQYGFSPLRPELAGQIQKGDIIVAGKNFGCGSSREQAPEIIKAMGVQCVIAKSFARIFFRNSINNGLLLIEQPDLYDDMKEGDGSPVYHFDFYRIKKLDEVYDMGYEDYFYSGNLCFLEWPELIEDLLPEDCTKVTITAEEDGTRNVEW